MKLLANENFPYKSIHFLKAKGYDVLSIGMDNPSIMDSEIMTIAINEERIILTFDRDYGELIFPFPATSLPSLAVLAEDVAAC